MYTDIEWLIFGTVRQFSAQFSALWDFFEKKIFELIFLAGPPARIIITPADILLRVRILIWLKLCKKIVW